jgi:hypothetical protein
MTMPNAKDNIMHCRQLDGRVAAYADNNNPMTTMMTTMTGPSMMMMMPKCQCTYASSS